MTVEDDVRTLLLALRLVGSTDEAGLAEVIGRLGGAVPDAPALLGRLELAGLVEDHSGRWRLLADGRAEGERLLRVELDALGSEAAVRAGYEELLALNGPLLRVCMDWQLADADPSHIVINDHTDEAYDWEVIGRLATLHRRARPMCDRLAAAIPRLGSYGSRLAAAMRRIDAGDHAALDGPSADSYHGTWFELHEHLIATLGLDRASEPLPDTISAFKG